MCGFDVCFLTGTDEHGLKIERAAQKMNTTPEKLTEENAEAFQKSWERLGIGFDAFIRTTQLRHHKTVQEIFELILGKGFIYQGEYSGRYCVRCEAYVANDEETCPDCGAPTEFIKEDSFFFKLSAFQEKLLAFYTDNPDFVIPETRMNEIVSFVRGGLKDVSISRTSFRWGIPVPGEDPHIFYVWFDALHGYLSGIGYGEDPKRFEKRWPAGVQLMGKDILRFHGVYWPAFLMAAGLEPPHHLLVHGWWTINGEKMSKSAGNFVTVDNLLGALPKDYIKYFLLREISLGSDGNFSYDALTTRVNSDLANDLGNLSSRVLKMIENYFEGRIPSPEDSETGDKELVDFSKETVSLYCGNFDGLRINRALENVWELIGVCNRYIVANEPWKLAKEASKRKRLGTVLYNSAECLRVIAVLLGPIVPDGTASILSQLGVTKDLGAHRLTDLNWGTLVPESLIREISPVYPRLDKKKFLASIHGKSDPAQPSQPESEEQAVGMIGIEDFAKVEMKVGRVLEAGPVPNSSKLVRMKVDVGGEVRQVIAGIGKAYTAAELEGRLVAVVTNLKPAKLMGLESNGMILAASEGGKPVLVTFTEPVKLGSRLR
jgi:methionyl-tRNA synthetase